MHRFPNHREASKGPQMGVMRRINDDSDLHKRIVRSLGSYEDAIGMIRTSLSRSVNMDNRKNKRNSSSSSVESKAITSSNVPSTGGIDARTQISDRNIMDSGYSSNSSNSRTSISPPGSSTKSSGKTVVDLAVCNSSNSRTSISPPGSSNKSTDKSVVDLAVNMSYVHRALKEVKRVRAIRLVSPLFDVVAMDNKMASDVRKARIEVQRLRAIRPVTALPEFDQSYFDMRVHADVKRVQSEVRRFRSIRLLSNLSEEPIVAVQKNKRKAKYTPATKMPKSVKAPVSREFLSSTEDSE